MTKSRPPELADATKLFQVTEPLEEGHAVEEMSCTLTLWRTFEGRHVLEEFLWDIDRDPVSSFREMSPDEADALVRRYGPAAPG